MEKKTKFIYAVGLFAVSYLFYKSRQNSQKPNYLLLYKNSKISKLFNIFSDNLNQSYQPTSYLLSGHIQTFLLELINVIINFIKKFFKLYKYHFQREILTLFDGGEIAIDHMINDSNNSPKENILIIIPGYTSTSEDYYIKNFAESFLEDFEVKIMIMRGNDNLRLTTPKMISFDSSRDLEFYLARISQMNYHKKIYCVGFSFGGMLLARYFGSNPSSIPRNVVAGAGVCYPYHLGLCAAEAEKTLGGIYSKFTCRSLKKAFFDNVDVIFDPNKSTPLILQHKDKILNEVANANLVSEFDQAYTVKFMEIDDVHQYYEQSKLDDLLRNIRKPFISIFTVDDPVIPFDTVPFKALESNKNLVTVVNQTGGHLAFFSGLIPERWIPQPVKTFFKTADYIIENQHRDNDDIIIKN